MVASARPRILVVDDDAEFLSYVEDGLGDFEVVTATTPLAALWILQRQPVHAVLCDLVLGAHDGRHLLEVVQAEYPQVARILVTGFGRRVDENDQSGALSVAQAILYKPCDAGLLAALLEELPVAPA